MNNGKYLWLFFCMISISMISPSVATALDFWNQLTKEEHVTISPFASLVTDPECKHPIDDFDIASHALTIGKISVSIALGGGDFRTALQGAKTMNWLPASAEVMLGDKLHELRSAHHGLINPHTKNRRYRKLYAKVNNVLNDVLAELPGTLPFDLKLFITTAHGINASAQPGGYLYITKQAAEKDKSFLAVMLAHEVFHIAQRHTTLQYQSAIIDTIDSFKQFKSFFSGSANVQQVAGLAMLTSSVVMSFNTKQEAQADTCAGRLITGLKGYHMNRGVKAFLRESAKGGDSSNPIFSNHPSYDQRAQLFQVAMSHKNTSPYWDKTAQHSEKRRSHSKERQSTAHVQKKHIDASASAKTFDTSTSKTLNTLDEARLALQAALDKTH